LLAERFNLRAKQSPTRLKCPITDASGVITGLKRAIQLSKRS